MNDYGMNNNRNTSGRAEGQDNPAHNHNFSLQRYVADAERNVYLRRPIVRLPEERRPEQTPTAEAPFINEPQQPNAAQKNNTAKKASERNEKTPPSPIKRPQKDDYVLEPPLGFYPLAGRTTYIGSHKKHVNKKLIAIIVAAVIVVIAFVMLNFGDRIISLFGGKSDEPAVDSAFYSTEISDKCTL